MSKNKFYQVGKSEKNKGKNTRTKGFDFFPSMPTIQRTLKPVINIETKAGKIRLFCILIAILLITSGGFRLIF